MLKKQLIISRFVFGIVVLSLASCLKLSICTIQCTMKPNAATCIVGEDYKIYYYFDKERGVCSQYAHIDGAIPFKTLEECEACGCHLVPLP